MAAFSFVAVTGVIVKLHPNDVGALLVLVVVAVVTMDVVSTLAVSTSFTDKCNSSGNVGSFDGGRASDAVDDFVVLLFFVALFFL